MIRPWVFAPAQVRLPPHTLRLINRPSGVGQANLSSRVSGRQMPEMALDALEHPGVAGGLGVPPS